jgi:hypothetical protein
MKEEATMAEQNHNTVDVGVDTQALIHLSQLRLPTRVMGGYGCPITHPGAEDKLGT